ncbi:MAG: cytochrome c, class [Acidobacteriaceae bacterium]|nr:cytochrome c, class [Acidobacteriaceae bacterium]
MNFQAIASALAILTMAICVACNRAPGRPAADSAIVRPDQIVDFNLLYSENCAGCHGKNGKGGAALALVNPVFLAIADDAVIRHTTASGVSGTAMPAFAQSAGGMLTDKQIDAIVHGIRSWAKPDALRDATVPPYTAQAPGDQQRGAGAYQTYCSSCHGPDGHGGTKASSIVDGAYLALVSDRDLRTTVIAGRPELGSPDWRGDVPGHPMSAQEISDLVAWLSSKRSRVPDQPLSITSINPANGGPQ